MFGLARQTTLQRLARHALAATTVADLSVQPVSLGLVSLLEIQARLISPTVLSPDASALRPLNKPWQQQQLSTYSAMPDTGRQKTVDPLWNWPNAISGGRLLCGPAIAHLILREDWMTALLLLGISGFSDWLDGYIARRFNQGSVLGSYLDPLADKVLIGCTAGALAYQGSLSMPLAGLIIGRDLFLVCGAFVLRFRSFGWRWPGRADFFRTIASAASTERKSTAAHSGAGAAESPRAATSRGQVAPERPSANVNSSSESRGPKQGAAEARSAPVEPAKVVQPLAVSKANTVAQLSLVAGCMTASRYGWPPEAALWTLGGATGLLTAASWGAYWRQYRATNRSGMPGVTIRNDRKHSER